MKRLFPGSLFAGAVFLSALLLAGDVAAQSGDSLSRRIGRIAGHLDLSSNHDLASELVETLSPMLDAEVIRDERRKLGFYDGTRANCGQLASDVKEMLENVRNPKPDEQG